MIVRLCSQRCGKKSWYNWKYYIVILKEWLRETRCLRRRSAAACLLRLWVRIPQGAWMPFPCECSVLFGRCLCVELITCPEESYRICCVFVCNLETSRMRRPWPALGRSATRKTEGKQCRMSNQSTYPSKFDADISLMQVSSITAWGNLKNKQGRLTLRMSVGTKELNLYRTDKLCSVYIYYLNCRFIYMVLSSYSGISWRRRSSRMLHFVEWWLVTDVCIRRREFTIRPGVTFLEAWIWISVSLLKKGAACLSETLLSTDSITQCY